MWAIDVYQGSLWEMYGPFALKCILILTLSKYSNEYHYRIEHAFHMVGLLFHGIFEPNRVLSQWFHYHPLNTHMMAQLTIKWPLDYEKGTDHLGINSTLPNI